MPRVPNHEAEGYEVMIPPKRKCTLAGSCRIAVPLLL